MARELGVLRHNYRFPARPGTPGCGGARGAGAGPLLRRRCPAHAGPRPRGEGAPASSTRPAARGRNSVRLSPQPRKPRVRAPAVPGAGLGPGSSRSETSLAHEAAEVGTWCFFLLRNCGKAVAATCLRRATTTPLSEQDG